MTSINAETRLYTQLAFARSVAFLTLEVVIDEHPGSWSLVGKCYARVLGNTKESDLAFRDGLRSVEARNRTER